MMKVNSNKKKFHVALSAALATSAIVTVATPVEASTIFKDVKDTDYFADAVKNLTDRGIVQGYSDGFRPHQDVTRAEAAKIIALALNLNLDTTKDPSYKDVSKDNWAYSYIEALTATGVVNGFGDIFKPNEPVTRAQMAKMIALAFQLETQPLTSSPFTDVSESGWYTEYVTPLLTFNITTGKTATTFAPSDNVTRGQLAAFVNRSEKAVDSFYKTMTVKEIKDNVLITSNGEYVIPQELNGLISTSNQAALKDATVSIWSTPQNKIKSIRSITLNTNGTAQQPVVLDGKNTTFSTSINVNADYVTIKDATILKDLTVGSSVQNSFISQGVTVKGKTTISNESKLGAASTSTSPTVSFTDSKLNSIAVSKTGVILEGKGESSFGSVTLSDNATIKTDATVTIPKLTIAEGANNVIIDSNVTSVEVTASKEVKLSGKGTITSLKVSNPIAINIETTGTIGTLETTSKDTTITLGANTKVTELNLPANAKADEVISNFEQVKGNVGGNTSTPPTTPPGQALFTMSLLHTNDIHARTDKFPKLVTAVKEERAKKPNALLVDAGDVFSGSLYFNEFKGQADLKFMNLMGYDVMTLGNHEFDLGDDVKGNEALADFIKAAKFPIISSNVDFSEDVALQGLFSDTISSRPEDGKIYQGMVKEVNGERVGFFGLTTEETVDIASPGKVKFEDYIEEAKKAVAAFEGMGVNKIVAVSHIGYNDNPNVDNDILLAKNVPGIDVIVGGHSHDELKTPVLIDTDNDGKSKDKTLIVQAYQYGDYLGSLDVTFNPAGKIVSHDGKLIKTADFQADPEALDLLKPYSDKIKEIESTETGATAAKELENPRSSEGGSSVRSNETPLGNLITDGMLAKAKQTDSSIIMALQNGGGIRNSINQGPITVGEVISVLPFGNTLATMELTGKELKEAFEISVKSAPGENGGFLHVSGAKVSYDSSKPAGSRVASILYKHEDGHYVQVKDNETYKIATNAFTAKGGDGYTVFEKAYKEGRVTDLGLSDWENFAEHLKKLETVNPTVEGRIKDVAGENFKLSLMHTNDMHARTEALPKMVTAVKDVRKEKPTALLVDAGDVFSGTLYFNEFKGQADIKFMNLMGYDVMTLGNHEFDLGDDVKGNEALAAFIKAAKFPFVSSNVDFSEDAALQGLFSDVYSSKPENGQIYQGMVKEVNGEKVGFFGLTTEETADIASPGKVKFENYLEEAKKAVAAFEDMGINKIVAVTHIGYNDNPNVDNDLLLAKNVPGIDVIVGGHSHDKLAAPVAVETDIEGKEKDKTIIVQAYQYADFLGTVDVEFDKDGKILSFNGSLVETKSKTADTEAIALLKEYADRVEAIESEETGAEATAALENPRSGNGSLYSVRSNETPLGNVITDGMLAKAKQYDSSIIMALQNGGGIRNSIDAGPITVGEVISVLPFGNTLATMELTGEELKKAFEISFQNAPGENGGFLHVSGAKVEYDSTKPVNSRVVSISYKDANGEYVSLKDEETYTIATNAFTAKGGDGYTVFEQAYKEGRVTDLGLSDWENFAEHLRNLQTVDPQVEGRIVDVSTLETFTVTAEEFNGTTEQVKVFNGDVTVQANPDEEITLHHAHVKGNLFIKGTMNVTMENVEVDGDTEFLD